MKRAVPLWLIALSLVAVAPIPVLAARQHVVSVQQHTASSSELSFTKIVLLETIEASMPSTAKPDPAVDAGYIARVPGRYQFRLYLTHDPAFEREAKRLGTTEALKNLVRRATPRPGRDLKFTVNSYRGQPGLRARYTSGGNTVEIQHYVLGPHRITLSTIMPTRYESVYRADVQRFMGSLRLVSNR
jgi:hypothetical protein